MAEWPITDFNIFNAYFNTETLSFDFISGITIDWNFNIFYYKIIIKLLMLSSVRKNIRLWENC